MGLDTHDRPRLRLAGFLTAQYADGHTIKRLARDIGLTPKRAENLLAGHWPSDTTLAAIVRRFGRDVLEVCFAKEIEPVLSALLEKERRLDRELHATRAERIAAQGGSLCAPSAGQGDLFEDGAEV